MKIIAKTLLLFSLLIVAVFFASTEAINRSPDIFIPLEIQSKALIQQQAKAAASSKQQGYLSLGWAQAEITAPPGTPTLGYGERAGEGAYERDGSLFAKAIAFQSAENTPVVMLTVDLCFWPNKLSQQLAARLSDALPRAHLFLGATHTHEGPGAILDAPLLESMFGTYSEEVVEIILSGAERAVRQAIDDLEPGAFRVHEIPIDEMVMNRTSSTLPVSHTAVVLELQKESGNKALITTYAAHATIIAPHPVISSANYPGALNKTLETSDWEFSAFFATETAQAGPGLKGQVIQAPGVQLAHTYGNLLASNIEKHISKEGKAFENTAIIQLLRSKIHLPDWGFRLPFMDRRLIPSITSALLGGQQPDAHIHGLAINQLVFIGHGFELSAEHGYRARQKASQKNITLVPLSFNGEHHFYVVPETSFDAEGYEPTMAFFGPHLAAYLDRLNDFLLGIFYPETSMQN